MASMPKVEDRKGTDRIVSRFVITCYENGAMQIEGPIDNYEYANAVLDNAKDAIRNRRSPKNTGLIIPHHDVTITEKL